MNLAGIFEIPILLSTAKTIRSIAIRNPVLVAEFFSLTMKAFFEALIRTGTGESGILGEVSNHAGVVETNGRGMLHLHGFIWLAGNLDLSMVRKKLLENEYFRESMIIHTYNPSSANL
jgi:hypothetical protein